MKIFVYGANGLVGQNVVDGLLKAGHEVYAGTRHPEKGKASNNLTWVAADAQKPTLGLEILEKVDSAFFLSPPGHTNQYDILAPWIEKAKAVKLKKLVLMTAMGVEHAPPEAPFRKTELLLENSGLNWNIIRPNWFMQNFNTYWISGILSDQKIYFPGGDAVASFIDARDIALVATKLLISDEFKNQAYALTGAEAINHDLVGKKISSVTGLNIQYVNVTPEDFKKGLLGVGLPEDYADFLNYIAGALKEGHAAAVTNSVQTITGHAPKSFDEYAKDFKSAWAKN
jgi:uncharacterized protein YbjT (DUF2867 family)